MNPVTQGLAVHPGQPRGACPIHPFQSVGDRDQPGADATIALPSRLSAQLLRTNVITDRQSRHCGSPLPRPQHLLLAKPCRCNFLGESASTQVDIRSPPTRVLTQPPPTAVDFPAIQDGPSSTQMYGRSNVSASCLF